MTVIHCPRCRDEVTVPPGATTRALVRCPLCLEQYLLSEALANAPPLLVIIGGEAPGAALQQTAETDNDYRVEAGGFSPAVFDASAPRASTVTIPRPAIRTGRRPQRREKSGLLFLVNVVAGGVLAAPLALLTLWWVFGVDPPELGPLGPKVARYAPWIVPVSLRGDTESDASTPATSDRVTSERRRQPAMAAKQRSNEPAELQALPGLDETPKRTIESAEPAIEAPREGTAKPAQPMPDLKDLLPD